MSRLVLGLAILAAAAALTGCNTRGKASIPEDATAEEERAQEEELKSIRAEEKNAPREPETERDDP